MKLGSILAAVALAAFAAIASAQQPIVIKFSHVVASDTSKGRAVEKFKELVEARTDGKVRVEVYPDSRLYKDLEEFEALHSGWVQMLAPSLSKIGALGVREFELFDLPYIFPNKATLYGAMDGEIGKSLFKKLEAKGVVGLAYWDNGFKQMSANRPLHTLEDFKGLKMRVQQGSRVLQAQMKALGARPRTLAFSDVYDALKTRAVQGTENPVSNFYTQGMHRVQKHLTVSDHGYLGYAVIVNKKFWDGLPADIRATLDQIMTEVTRYERDIAQRENDDALAAVKNAGTTEVYLLPADERQRWARALEPVRKEFEARIGYELVRSINQLASQPGKE